MSHACFPNLPHPIPVKTVHHMFMATTPRFQLVDNELPMHYHLISRCVRRAFLCGYDKPSRKKYDHRKGWLEERLFHLAKYFAVDLEAHVIMSNHFHLIGWPASAGMLKKSPDAGLKPFRQECHPTIHRTLTPCKRLDAKRY